MNTLVTFLISEVTSINQWKSVLLRGVYEELDGATAKEQLHLFTEGVKEIINREKEMDVHFIKDNIPAFIQGLKEEKGKDIWLIGGGQLNGLFLKHHLIDEMIISVLPVVLGVGLPLFGNMEMESIFEVKEVKLFESGIVQLIYSKPVDKIN